MDLPDNYNELQSLASEAGKEQVIGASKEELKEWLQENYTQTEEDKTRETDSDTQEDEAESSSDSSEASPEQADNIEEHSIDLTKHIGSSDEEESTESEPSETVSSEGEAAEQLEEAIEKTEGKGMAEAIDNLWGRVWTIDKDPDSEEAEHIRENLSRMAEDVGLGENAKWWAEENIFTEEEQSPTQALMISLCMASVMSLGMREDLMKKGYEKVKQDFFSDEEEQSSTSETVEEEDEESE